MKWRPSIPVLIIFLGAILRVFLSFWWGFSNDELSALSRTVYSNFSDLIEHGVKETDMHPAGVQIFLFGWVKLFGTQEWIVRLPFILASSFGLYGFYKFFRLYWTENAATLFLVFASFLFYPIMNSLFARPYAIGFFFIGLALYFIEKLIKEEWNWKLVVWIGLSWAGVFYSNYFATLFAGVLALLILPLIPRNKLLGYVSAGVLAVILYLPHWSITSHHLNQGGLGWLPPPKDQFIFDFLYHFWNSSAILITILGVLALVGIVFLIKEKRLKHQLYNGWALVCFFSIVIAAFYYSIHVTPILKFQTLFFAFPFLLIVVSDWVHWPANYSKQVYFTSIFVLILATSIWSKDLFSRTKHFAVYRELAIDADSYSKEYTKEEIEFVTSNLAPYYVDFYFKRYNLDYFELPVKSFENEGQLDSILKNSDKSYFYYAYSNAVHAPNNFEIIRNYFPSMIEAKQYYHSGTWLFSKEKGKRQFKEEFEFDFLSNLPDSSGSKLISKGVFSDAFKINVKDVSYTENDYFLFEIDCKVPDDGNIVLVMVGEREGKVIEDNDVSYYLAKGSDGKTGGINLKLVGDIKTYMMNEGGEEQFVFYIWNSSEESILIDKAKLYLVDPSLTDKTQ